METNLGINPIGGVIVFFYRISSLLSFFLPLSLIFTYLNLVLFGIYIHPKAKIGKRFKISHPVGTVIGKCEIGNDVNIKNCTTVGNKENHSNEYPKIGNNVIIYSNCVIIGNVVIGDNSIIGACSFINKSVPKNSVVYNKRDVVVKKK